MASPAGIHHLARSLRGAVVVIAAQVGGELVASLVQARLDGEREVGTEHSGDAAGAVTELVTQLVGDLVEGAHVVARAVQRSAAHGLVRV